MANRPLLIDAHQDLAWNMLTFGRDYTRAAHETRRHERRTGSQAYQHNGDTLLGWPDYQAGRVALIFATLFVAPARRSLGPWDVECYRDGNEARLRYRAQLDAYHRLFDEHPDKFRLVENRTDLDACWQCWPGSAGEDGDAVENDEPTVCPVGVVLLMEGGEAIGETTELEEWWARGLRLLGPAWAGTRFCGGTGEPGPLTPEGYELLDAMADLHFGLDISHMDETAALQALDHYGGQVLASHANASALLKGVETNRHLSDRVIQGLIERDGVMGIVPHNPFLKAGWRQADGRETVSLADVAAQIDHVCQIAGDASHVGLGSDFDGGFGWQSTPHELDTIADLQQLAPFLAEMGYGSEEIGAILGQNWHSWLQRALPEH